MKTIHISTSTPYDVIIERGSIAKCGSYISGCTKSKKAAIITDDIVGKLYADTVVSSLRACGFKVRVFTFPNGEASKNLCTLGKIYNFLCEYGITRSDLLIALGGGVVGDITGLAAATFLRGIDLVQIPTTLLAQVDSSVGGKTAVDIPGGKNLVGAFKQPVLVLCDSNTLSTLPESELACGMAEAVKYGMIRDKQLFELIESHDLSNVSEVIDDIVFASIDIKRDVVEHDEFDKGDRFILNFGHTLGHAIEGWHNYSNYTHGMGVSAVMCMITERFASPDLAERLRKCVTAYKLPVGTEAPMKELLPFCSVDKKRDLDSISFVVCMEVGKAEIRRVSLDEFYRLMEV